MAAMLTTIVIAIKNPCAVFIRSTLLFIMLSPQ
jgi:hypothetical protein